MLLMQSAAGHFVSADEFLKKRIAISDTKRFTSSSNPVSCFDPETQTIYSPYHAAFSGYGEQMSVFALAETPIPAVSGAKNHVLLQSGVPFQGKKYRNPVDASAIIWKNQVRVFFLANSSEYYFFDWSKSEHKITTPIQPLLCKSPGSETLPLTAEAVKKFLDANNCTGYRLTRDPREHIIMTSRPARVGDTFYGTITSGWSQPVLFRCSDGKTIEFLSVIPAIAQYECAITVLNNKVYALLRGTTAKDNFFAADMNDWKFRPCGRLPAAETRAQMLTRNGKVLIAYSQNGILPNKIRNGRNNMIILEGEGEDLKNYKEIFRVVDEIGFVSFDIVECHEDLYVIWSNSERFPDQKVSVSGQMALQGKDVLFCSKLTAGK
ncbi:MAG: hypothetical protein E7057_04605 [Lentisphaerae bacterium]|nr:hypothetical protein [Lentisphaerota bacterium]